MGQRIENAFTLMGDVAIFSGDRSLGGQEGETFSSPAEAAAGGTYPAMLASRLFETDDAIDHVYIFSNDVIVRRAGGWDDRALETTGDTLEGLFVFYTGREGEDEGPIGGEGAFVEVGQASPGASPGGIDEPTAAALRNEHYNATITYIREIHEKLWILGVLPDTGMPSFEAGQYATLGLGFWEPRLDGLVEDLSPEQARKLARRSYSISSPMIEKDGRLVLLADETAVEIYVVLVERDWQEQPALLTPRLFLKQEGDKLYMGRKIAGRYRLDKMSDPEADVFFLSTGTGEAPHNRMIVELLDAGHAGRITSACTARYWRDLAYVEEHRELERRYPNYRYLPLTTREPENRDGKVYIQDLISNGTFEEVVGSDLDATRMHFFLCGNPAMIGLPEWKDDQPEFPDVVGVAELLTERGFTLDRGRDVGTIHYEEYW